MNDTATLTETEAPAVADPVLLRAAEIVRERWSRDRYFEESGCRCAIGAIWEAEGGTRLSLIDAGGFPNTWDFGWSSERVARLARSLGVEGAAGVTDWNFNVAGAGVVAEALERAAYGL